MPNRQTLYVFIGHDYYQPTKQAYRLKVKRALGMSSRCLPLNLKPIYGDTPLTQEIIRALRSKNINAESVCSDNYWPRIIAYIQLSDLIIIDLRAKTHPRQPVNWNVLLELGVAYSQTSSRIILVKNRRFILQHLSNIHGVEIEEPPRKNIDKFISSRVTARVLAKINAQR